MDFAGINSLFKNLKLFEERIPPSCDIGLYYYILDNNVFCEIKNIINSKVPFEKKLELSDKVKKEFKDFNDYVKKNNNNFIDIKKCIKYSNSVKDEKIDFLEIFNRR
jgi:hypothetical protein